VQVFFNKDKQKIADKIGKLHSDKCPAVALKEIGGFSFVLQVAFFIYK
jgi:hypothetical protein